MNNLETVKIKHSDADGNDHLIINKSDFDPNKHELFDGSQNADDGLTDEERDAARKKEAERKVEANRGVPGGRAPSNDGRNPSGTYSEPTPTDIRYPNKDHTEFENNYGAHIRKSAAEMREDMGLPDEPGGLKALDQPKGATAEGDDAPGMHVGKGPRGLFYVMNGKERVSKGFVTEAEADAALAAEQPSAGTGFAMVEGPTSEPTSQA